MYRSSPAKQSEKVAAPSCLFHARGTGAVAIIAIFLITSYAQAAKIGEITETSTLEQATEFLSLGTPLIRNAVLGAIALGLGCGLLGAFIVVRKLSLMGDTLSHAVLPGVALGFLWSATKDPVAIFIGASAAGLLGTVLVSLIKETTPIKEDSALGMVLAGFFALGIVLVTMIQNLPVGNKAGLDKYFFGQAAALSEGDVRLMLIVTGIAALTIAVFYKELLVTSFDPAFARANGIPAQVVHYLIMALLAFAVVVALQAVGVVLVSAMLITPAATAYLLTDRMHWMLVLSATFGTAAGLLGAFFSYLGNNLPTGPFMVVAASVVFAAAFFLGPRHGLVPRWRRQRNQTRRIGLENTLKAAYHVREARDFTGGDGVTLAELASRRNVSMHEAETQALALETAGFATLHRPKSQRDYLTNESALFLTPQSWLPACQIVRNHRLWELYLTNAAHYAADHVHEDAEVIEHVLGEEIVRRLEKRLDFPTRDPHGKIIPGDQDLATARAALHHEPEGGAGFVRR